ncbi:MAG: hypothetical protein ABIE22_00460 [archaeon]
MKSLLNFEEYLKKGIVKKQRPDMSRANFLIQESDKSFLGLKQRVEKLKINDLNANSIIKDAHDIVLELVRSKMLLQGYSASGFSAHEAEVAYMGKLGFSKVETDFMNEIRFLRNRILYYGKSLDKEYAEKVYAFLHKIYPRLKNP